MVVPSRSTCRLTLRCLETLLEAGVAGLELVLVDDASEDDTVEQVRIRVPQATIVIFASSRGFTAAANAGVEAASGEVVLLLNSDTEVPAGSLQALLSAFRNEAMPGVLGATLEYPDGSPQWSGGPRPGLLWLFLLASGLPALLGRHSGAYRRLRSRRREAMRRVDWVSGAAMAFRRQVWHQVGPLDERFHFYCQDLDFCLRSGAAGWDVAVLPEFRVIHHHGSTIRRYSSETAGPRDPGLLWNDLLMWVAKSGTGSRVRLSAGVLVGGALLRLMARRAATWMQPRLRRAPWERHSRIYRQAIRRTWNLWLQPASSTQGTRG